MPPSKILAFDQTLANTGWALLIDGVPQRTGMIITPANDEGWRGNIKRGTRIEAEVDTLLFEMLPAFVVAEMPVTKGKFARPESSALAAQAVSIAASRRDIPFDLMSNQHMKKVIVGRTASVSKADVRTAVERLLPGVNLFKPYNEHVVDAIAIGLTAHYDEQGAHP